MSALKNGQLVVPKGKGGQRRAIKLSPYQTELITKYLEYAKATGLHPGDYLISSSDKHGVLDEKRSLQNWMSYNREKFIVKDREKIVEDGKKKRHATISWHGLRHGYLYDDKLVITFNYKKESKTVTLKEVNGSIIECSGAPKHSNPNLLPVGETFGFVFFVKDVK